MLGLLYFGRLEKEKWFDGIIDMIEMFEKKWEELSCKLFIFGSGSGEKRIQELASRNPNIHFFWRQNLETIKRYIVNCNYCLMPSECLESFGLSALTAMKRWLPVIWYAKWGLKDFIAPTLDLTHPGTRTAQWAEANHQSRSQRWILSLLQPPFECCAPSDVSPFSLSDNPGVPAPRCCWGLLMYKKTAAG